MKSWFLGLADTVCEAPPGIDRVTLHLESEQSDFVRFNRSRVRQMTRVSQHHATLSVVRGLRRASCSVGLSGAPDGGSGDGDAARLLAVRAALCADLDSVPDDPHLRLPSEVVDSDRDDATGTSVPDAEAIVAAVLAQAQGLDLVGFYAAGPAIRAFADSRGQRNWHRVTSFHLDWSLYLSGDPSVRDRAVKASYAGTTWDPTAFAARMDAAKRQADWLARPPQTIEPGAWRAYLAPQAVAEIVGTLAWGGFGAKARRTGTSTLTRLDRGEATLAPVVRLSEATADGLAPGFTSQGQRRPPRVPLIADGRCAETLVSARTGAEFGLDANADEGEQPESLAMAGGDLDADGALAALESGLWVGNLWYLGYSDRQACRMTGMTRFACFLVERGEIVAPIGVMRFDDSFLRLFGEGLLALTAQTEFMPSGDTYGQRHLASVTAPGALVDAMRFTL